MDEEFQIWKVFIPSNLLEKEKGMVLGNIVNSKQLVCIKDIQPEDNRMKTVIGVWLSEDNIRKQQIPIHSGLWIELSASKENVVKCVLTNSEKQRTDIKTQCILYDPDQLMSSYILTNRSLSHGSEEHEEPNRIKFLHDNISTVLSCLLKSSADKRIRLSQRGATYGLFYLFCVTLFHPFICLFLLLGKVFDNQYTRIGFAKTCLDSPALTRQLRHRTNALRSSLTSKSDSPIYHLSFLDACGRQLLDSLLGVCVLYFLLNASLADLTATRIMDWADNVAGSLTELIHWMMGAPAGLKLNSQLTHFLGHFFLYHIYLWTGYLSLLRPALGVLLKYSSVLGVVGVSTQLCLVQDILSMMTIHIYCFYVYAARLYSIQVYGLASLWRLFRGKKWNVLRHRVDSAVYDIDQLFVGTLFFTILLFLLPTTLLYYVFFLALRLVVLFTEGVLAFCVRLINHIPVYSILMWLLRSNTVAGDVMFSVVPNSATESCLVLTMKPTQLSLGQLLEAVRVSPLPATSSESLGTLLHKILKGKLIYPWIEDTNKSGQKLD